MPLLALLIGALLGAIGGNGLGTAVAGGFVGLIVGLVISALRKSRASHAMPDGGRPGAIDGMTLFEARVSERLRAIERRLDALEDSLPTPAERSAPAPADTAAPSVTTVATAPSSPEAGAPPSAEVETSPSPGAETSWNTEAEPARTRISTSSAPLSARPAAGPDVPRPAAPAFARWGWLTGGNALARVGILVLFIGIGFLLKYAAERVSVPIELRIAGVALGGIALLVLGWRLRARRTAYAMLLQGGGVGVLYLAAFAAFRLYALVPAPAAFALLVAIAALSAVLAIRQDAITLAAAGVVGGFLAPILTSSQSGNHVALFAYYTLLNAGILGVAWFKAWRVLNLLGFACTFAIGTLWGVTRYRPDDFATTEPFLVLFFLFYLAIGVLYALRRSVSLRDYVDGTIVFGTPLVAAGLQQALVSPFEFAMAISAVTVATLYLVLARVLWARHREELRLLAESFLALGVVFATLAIPLAFDARWTSATWALEGAAIVWIGIRQRRIVARSFGLLLQLAAGVAFALGSTGVTHHAPPDVLPVLNSAFLGAVLVALAGLLSALAYQRRGFDLGPTEQRVVLPLAFAWGALWWLFAGARDIDRFVASTRQPAVRVGFATATAITFAVASRALAWPIARIPALLLGPALLFGAVVAVGAGMGLHAQLFAHGGVIAWPLGIAVVAWLAHRFEREAAYLPESTTERALHSVLLWLITIVAANEIAWMAGRFASGGTWYNAAWGLVPALAVATICHFSNRPGWPIGEHRVAYLASGAAPLVLWMLSWSLVVGVASAGDPAPLPYVPLLNPVDVTLGFIAASVVAWTAALQRENAAPWFRESRFILAWVAAAFVFLWVNAIALRTLHHWFGIDWSLAALWGATLVQAVLTLLWTVIALATMVTANRAAARVGWIAGAVLLAIVVLKLFLIDLSRIGSIERIVSFIGVGLLLLLIGYLAPVPARKREAT